MIMNQMKKYNIPESYELLDQHWIKDVDSAGLLLRHKKTGARVAILSNEDSNKVFSIGFRTPPKDETGVPHIIEHTVLCGSAKYPVKDPFIELVKGSLNTFLNAMTYPDKTIYPMASYNDRDFDNLMDVYLDAVFHPNIIRYEEIFKQEGWHYELESTDAPLQINGVVYNEMKGAYSSPEEVLQTQINRSLFPDNTYSCDSGGNPQKIPELTYEQYLAFYHTYYHPSNAWIYLYGDMDVTQKLIYMDRDYLSAYDYLEMDTRIPAQKAFEQPRNIVEKYSISEEDNEEKKTYLSYNRVVCDADDRRTCLAFEALDYALVSAPGAPVRRALIEAGIGDDVSGSFNDETLQPVYSIVAANADLADRERFLTIIQDTLQTVVNEGVNPDSLLASINSSEFSFREADYGMFPKGLLYGIFAMGSWFYDEDRPFLRLECLDAYAWLKEQIGTGYFEDLIRTRLLDNPHGSCVAIVPEKGRGAREEAALEKLLAEKKAAMSEEEKEEVVRQTLALREYQETPSTAEELATIPMLGREDLKKEAMAFSNEEKSIDGTMTLVHEIPTNGIDYLSLLFECSDIPAEELGYLGLLSSVLGYVDTDEYAYMDLANAVHIHTGGIHTGMALFTEAESGRVISKFEVSLKTLSANLPKTMELAGQILLHSHLKDAKRLKEILSQARARLQLALSERGNSVAYTRALSGFSEGAYRKDHVSGIRYYRKLCEIEKQLAEDPTEVSLHLQKLLDRLICRSRLMISYTGDAAGYQKTRQLLGGWLHDLPQGNPAGDKAVFVPERRQEGFTDASQIQYVALAGNFREHGYSYRGSLRLLKNILSLDYLWNQVRVKGGAYGCGVNFLRNGDAWFESYRDPKLGQTLQTYRAAADYIRSFDPDERDMTKYVIGTFGGIDNPMNPEALGTRSLRAWLEGVTYEMVQKERDEIRLAQPADIRVLADLVEAFLADACCCALGNENKLRGHSELFDRVEKLV